MEMLSNKDAAQFPFLVDCKPFVKGHDIDTLDLQKVDEYLLAIYQRKPPEYFESLEAIDSIKKFIGCCLVLNQVGCYRAILKFATYEAAKFIMRLKYILNKKGVDEFHTYASIIFRTIYGEENFISMLDKTLAGVSIYICHVTDYLTLIENIIGLDEKYIHLQLTNQVGVTKGNVLFERHVLIDIFEQRIKHFIIERIKAMFDPVPTDLDVKKRRKKRASFHGVITLSKELHLLINKIEYIDTYTQVYRYEKEIPKKEKYDVKDLSEQVLKLKQGSTPPCISTIMDAFGNRPIKHFERFLLASFLLTKQVDMNEIIEIFARDVKFNEEITRDQLEQMSKRDYKPPSCDKISMHDCCYRSKEICGSIVNPAQLIS